MVSAIISRRGSWSESALPQRVEHGRRWKRTRYPCSVRAMCPSALARKVLLTPTAMASTTTSVCLEEAKAREPGEHPLVEGDFRRLVPLLEAVSKDRAKLRAHDDQLRRCLGGRDFAEEQEEEQDPRTACPLLGEHESVGERIDGDRAQSLEGGDHGRDDGDPSRTFLLRRCRAQLRNAQWTSRTAASRSTRPCHLPFRVLGTAAALSMATDARDGKPTTPNARALRNGLDALRPP